MNKNKQQISNESNVNESNEHNIDNTIYSRKCTKCNIVLHSNDIFFFYMGFKPCLFWEII